MVGDWTSFRKRNSIKFQKIWGESEEIGECSEWKEKLMEMIFSYGPDDVFDANETVLFYRCVLDYSTLNFKSYIRQVPRR